MNGTLFGNRLFADGGKDEVILEQDGLLVRYVRWPCKRRRDTGRQTGGHTRRMPCGDTGRGWRDAARSQGTPRIVRNTGNEAKNVGQIPLPRAFRENTALLTP